ncbi:MAG: M15 family metallopeptidase [Pseudomonadota bacterium]
MARLSAVVATLALLPATGALAQQAATSSPGTATVSLAERLELLVSTYPDTISGVDGNQLELKSGEAIVIDDGEEKTHAQRLANADIEDMLAQVYPLGFCDRDRPATNFDPGRIRNEALMKAIYGASASAVRRKLVTVDWFGRRLRVTSAAGAADQLRKVARGLEKIDPAHAAVFKPTAGTFNWRRIARTRRLSVHAFAAAIDLNVKFADYWVWSGGRPGNVPRYRNRVPRAIVEVFERHGFIWGGKWYHFDTMHFEYRPALIAIARAAERRGCVR